MTDTKHTSTALTALLNYKQADADGVMVLVSRQAIHEVAAENAALLEALNTIDALDPEGFVAGLAPAALMGLVSRMGEIARAAIAKATGGQS